MSSIANITVDISALESLICGITNTTSALEQSAFFWRESAFHKGQEDIEEWFIENYSLLAGVNEMICSASGIIQTALTNGEIKITAKEATA